MKAILFPGNGNTTAVCLPDPVPEVDEVVISVRVSGICGTDLHYLQETPSERGSRAQIVPGHEVAGEVAESGSAVRGFQVGDRVIGLPHVGCGFCRSCRSDRPAQCPRKRVLGRTLNGSDGELVVLPWWSVLRLPNALSFDDGALVACNAGTSYAALARLERRAPGRMLVVGQGGVGLCATVLASSLGWSVLSTDLSTERRALSKDMGADIALVGSEEDFASIVLDWTDGEGVDAVVECTGSTAPLQCAFEVAGKGCEIALVGMGGELNLPINGMLSSEFVIRGSSVFGPTEAIELMSLIQNRRIDFGPILCARYTIDNAHAAFDHALRQPAGKVLFDWARR